jgi:hypothetical protein
MVMGYKKIKSFELSESELREIWLIEYCSEPIETFDGIKVRFYPSMFNHCFYESANRKAKDKSILSLNRLEKIYWIKETLQDINAILKQGWDKDAKLHSRDKRVAVVKGNYIVIIRIFREGLANFVTAFQVDNDENLNLILRGPDWDKKNTAD